MTLSDRLAAAAKAREAASGDVRGSVSPPHAATPSTPTTEPLAPAERWQGSRSEPERAATAQATAVAVEGLRIVSPAAIPVAAVTPDPLAAPVSICPTCGRTGELGVVDLPGQTGDWSCLACGTLWQVKLEDASAD